MNAKVIEEWLNNVATPTGISYSGDKTISKSMVKNIVDYVEELQEVINRISNETKETRNKINNNRHDNILSKCYLLTYLANVEDILMEVSK